MNANVMDMSFVAHCGSVCGLGGAGGAGGVNPEWLAKLILPGMSSNSMWKITYRTELDRGGVPNRRNQLTAGAATVDLKTNGVTEGTFDLGAGQHDLKLLSWGQNPWRGCSGGANGLKAYDDYSVRVTITAKPTAATKK